MTKDSTVDRAFGFLPSFSSPLFHENLREFESHRRQYCSWNFLGQCDLWKVYVHIIALEKVELHTEKKIA